jgi:hypothetical protein
VEWRQPVHVRNREDDREKIETIREGKQPVIAENVPETRPGYGLSSRNR